MRIQDYFIEMTKRAARDAFRYARAVPADKLTWSPDGEARSVLDLCREMAMTPKWAIDIIEGRVSEDGEEVAAALEQIQSEWKTVEDCEAQFEERAVALYDLFKNMPDSRLSETRFLPYEGGRDFTMVELMEYAGWHLNYHGGQIGYVQVLYGDKEMH